MLVTEPGTGILVQVELAVVTGEYPQRQGIDGGGADMVHGRLLGHDAAGADENGHTVQRHLQGLLGRPLERGPREPVHPPPGREPHLLAGHVALASSPGATSMSGP